MPWNEVKTVDLRLEFVTLAACPGANISELCRRFAISRKTGYKWLHRYRRDGNLGLKDQSKQPHHSPALTPLATTELILKARERFPDWGGRKLKRVLEDEGHTALPSPSTITSILRREDLLNQRLTEQVAWTRFEHPHPNDLWQMDFKGHFATARGQCHPLTILDDHSRYSLCLEACQDEQLNTVKPALIRTFSRFGLPFRMTMDNGPPWGSAGGSRYTQLTVWLIELGITITHSRPYHPQTQGKDERFHRTLQTELIGRRQFLDLQDSQRHFDTWRHRYNFIRPHESLNMDTPANHYQSSARSYNPNLAPYEYGASDSVRKVGANMAISFQRYELFLGKAFVGKSVAIRPSSADGVYTAHFCHQQIAEFNLRDMAKRKR